MKVLIVCRRKKGKVAAFITDQVAALNRIGVETDFFYLEQKGINGYLRSLKEYYNKIRTYNPDLVHAHYGLSGLFANFQRKAPVITTYHGSDINNKKVFFLSKLAMILSKYNVFVSNQLRIKSGIDHKYSVIPCGVDEEIFYPMQKNIARHLMGYSCEDKLVLFSSSFDIKVKNYPLARDAINLIDNVRLLELRGYSREQVSLLLNVCDAALMTSNTEGSPQFIKEAMACNCPIVSVDVGDVKGIIDNVDGCSIALRDPIDISEKLRRVMTINKTKGVERIHLLGLNQDSISRKIFDVYKRIVIK